MKTRSHPAWKNQYVTRSTKAQILSTTAGEIKQEGTERRRHTGLAA
jgi:hypothetical protein